MNVCILGNSLTSLSLAKNLVNKKINVDICYEEKKNNLSSNRTIGISNSNFNFFQKKIMKLNKKDIWEISKMKIYSEKKMNDKILDFQKSKKNYFLMIKNNRLCRLLNIELKKNKFFKKKVIKKNFYRKLLKEKKYDLIINCESKNYIGKKYFSKKISKDYNNVAFTTTLKHTPLINNTAIQIFTKHGPLAFLPISKSETSVVYSFNLDKKRVVELNICNLIKEYNPKYLIKNVEKLNKFKLESFNSKSYYYKNIIAFGDCAHRIHPLAGQGFNMIIRDIKIISEIIQKKIDLGIQLDSSISVEFEKNTKHLNLIFATGIDFIYEFFNFERKNKSKNINKIIKFLGKNKNINNIFTKYADEGLTI